MAQNPVSNRTEEFLRALKVSGEERERGVEVMGSKGAKIKCFTCGDIIQSLYRHDFKWCKCGCIAVDGGGDYLKISTKVEEPGYKGFEILEKEEEE